MLTSVAVYVYPMSQRPTSASCSMFPVISQGLKSIWKTAAYRMLYSNSLGHLHRCTVSNSFARWGRTFTVRLQADYIDDAAPRRRNACTYR